MDDFLLDVSSDSLSRDHRAADNIRNATKVDNAIDAFFERLEVEVGATRTQSLAKSEIADIVGLPESDLDQPRKPSLKASLQRASLASLTDLSQFAKRHGEDCERAFRMLEKKYQSAGTLTEAMRDAADLFSNVFTADENSLLDKAIQCLDVPLFLRLMAAAVGRSA